eukprot:146647_1
MSINPALYCAKCKIACNSQQQYQQHINSNQHNKQSNYSNNRSQSLLNKPQSVSLFSTKIEPKYNASQIGTINTKQPSQIGTSLLSPLSPISPNNNVTPKPISSTNTLVILDFDNTLFPSEEIRPIFLNKSIPKPMVIALDNLGLKVFDTLTQLGHKFGYDNIKIISNGSSMWISHALQYVASFSNAWIKVTNLISKHIVTYSAHDMYAKRCPLNHELWSLWKCCTYRDIITVLNTNNKYKNIISIGDQWLDHTAVDVALKNIYINVENTIASHSFKLKANPSFDDMIEEMDWIDAAISGINE